MIAGTTPSTLNFGSN